MKLFCHPINVPLWCNHWNCSYNQNFNPDHCSASYGATPSTQMASYSNVTRGWSRNSQAWLLVKTLESALARAQRPVRAEADRARSAWARASPRYCESHQLKAITDDISHQQRLGDDILHYFQVVLYELVFGVGTLHLLIGEEAKEKRLVLEFALFQNCEKIKGIEFKVN